jgi:hypothetical protein
MPHPVQADGAEIETSTKGYAMQTSEVLNRAADLIEKRGWWSPTSKGALCANNAISEAADSPYAAAHEAFKNHIGGRVITDIWDWNDAPDRTADEVIATLRACALIEAAKENAETRESVTA